MYEILLFRAECRGGGGQVARLNDLGAAGLVDGQGREVETGGGGGHPHHQISRRDEGVV